MGKEIQNKEEVIKMAVNLEKNKYKEWQAEEANKVIQHLAESAVDEILLEE